jgi:hypothetical protein
MRVSSLVVFSGDDVHVFAACPVEKPRGKDVAESGDSFLYKDSKCSAGIRIAPHS